MNTELKPPSEPREIRERFLALKSPQELAHLLDVEYRVLVFHLYKSDKAVRYRQFSIPKRNGGTRTIMSPHPSLREIQRKLNTVLTAVYTPKPSAHGFVKKRSILTNAKAHCNRRLILNVDLEEFFPTINFGRVRGVFIARPYALPPAVATVLAQICCFDNQLPQGAPTSPVVSNMVCSRMDTQLQRLAKKHGLSYTRYADDITLSTYRSAFPDEVCSGTSGSVVLGPVLNDTIAKNGFVVNKRKIYLQRRDSHQEVTGVTVNNRKPNAPRHLIREIRAMLHAWDKFDLTNAAKVHFHGDTSSTPAKKSEGMQFASVLQGKIAYLGMIREKDGLYNKYRAFFDRLVTKADPELLERQEVPVNISKIFISHAAKDKALATALVQCLEGCMEIPDRQIRCTSVDGYKLEPGTDAHESLRENLAQCEAVIGLITENSLQSGFVFMELGAAWGLRKYTYPVLGAGIDFDKIPGPLRTTHSIKLDNTPDITEFISSLAKKVGFSLRNPGRTTAAVQTFVAVATSEGNLPLV